MTEPESTGEPQQTERLAELLESAVERLEQAGSFAKLQRQGPVLDLTRRLLPRPGAVERLAALAPRMDEGGVFRGSDWDEPTTLQPDLVSRTLDRGEPELVVLECLSLLRMLAIARGGHARDGVTPEHARRFLTQVLALNLNRQFDTGAEADRVRLGPLAPAVGEVLRHIQSHVGLGDTLGSLIDEIWRILAQRPIQVGPIKAMITQVAATLTEGGADLGEAQLGADRLVSGLFGPTHGCTDDPGLPVYRERLAAMDAHALQREARGFARAMHDIGLVSDYHAAFLRHLIDTGATTLVPDALGLSSTGRDVLRCHAELVHRLIADAVHVETAQAAYGLAMLLERGLLHMPPIAPALWRQIALEPSAENAMTLAAVFGDALPPRVFLLAGVVSLLGQPLGVGQGNNPTCQAARALSLWSCNDPDYLLDLVHQATLRNGIVMHFEGQPLASAEIEPGGARRIPLDTDPVSIVLVPHLDRVYTQMGRLCAQRGGDPHRWINPELHGWWVGRAFQIAVDVPTGRLLNYDTFLRRFHADYHPEYNGNQPVIHAQPAGLAVTDSGGDFVGWHAISIIRVARDQEGVMRVYFFNPNNDSGQNWGDGVVVSTEGHGERFGESSLPFDQMASRIYIFHADPSDERPTPVIPDETIERVRTMATATWAADRLPPVETPPVTPPVEPPPVEPPPVEPPPA